MTAEKDDTFGKTLFDFLCKYFIVLMIPYVIGKTEEKRILNSVENNICKLS